MISGGLIGAAGAAIATAAIVFIAGWLFWGMWPHERPPGTRSKTR